MLVTPVRHPEQAQDDTSNSGTAPRPLAARIAMGMIRALPSFSVQPVARTLAGSYRLLAPRKLRRARANLDLAFADGLVAKKKDRIARASLLHQAVSMLETVRELTRPGCVTIEGVEEFDRLFGELEKRGRGQLLLTAHLGSWELLNRAATRAAANGFFALAKRPHQRTADSLLDDLRQAAGTQVLASGAKSTLRRMVEVLADNGWIGLAMDQRPEGSGIPVQFFGRETEFVVGPATMIERQGCAALVAFCIRTGRARYRLQAHEVEFSSGATREEITQRLATELERVIRQVPEQWLWTYRRWPGASLHLAGDG